MNARCRSNVSPRREDRRLVAPDDPGSLEAWFAVVLSLGKFLERRSPALSPELLWLDKSDLDKELDVSRKGEPAALAGERVVRSRSRLCPGRPCP